MDRPVAAESTVVGGVRRQEEVDDAQAHERRGRAHDHRQRAVDRVRAGDRGARVAVRVARRDDVASPAPRPRHRRHRTHLHQLTGYVCSTELSMGWVDPWVGLGRVGLGREFSVFRGLVWVGSTVAKVGAY